MPEESGEAARGHFESQAVAGFDEEADIAQIDLDRTVEVGLVDGGDPKQEAPRVAVDVDITELRHQLHAAD